jgi:hypothetical protein
MLGQGREDRPRDPRIASERASFLFVFISIWLLSAPVCVHIRSEQVCTQQQLFGSRRQEFVVYGREGLIWKPDFYGVRGLIPTPPGETDLGERIIRSPLAFGLQFGVPEHVLVVVVLPALVSAVPCSFSAFACSKWFVPPS